MYALPEANKIDYASYLCGLASTCVRYACTHSTRIKNDASMIPFMDVLRVHGQFFYFTAFTVATARPFVLSNPHSLTMNTTRWRESVKRISKRWSLHAITTAITCFNLNKERNEVHLAAVAWREGTNTRAPNPNRKNSCMCVNFVKIVNNFSSQYLTISCTRRSYYFFLSFSSFQIETRGIVGRVK